MRLKLLVATLMIIGWGSIYSQEMMLGGCVVTFDLMGNDTICANSPMYTFPAGAPAGGIFSGPGVTDEFFDPSVVGPGQYTITYSYSDQNCTGSASVVLTVVPAENLGFIGDFDICAGETTVISSSTGQQYTWANGANTVSQSYTPAETLVTYANGLTASGCNVTTPFTITVGALPEVTITGITSVCLGDTTYLTIVGADNWQWYNGSTQPTIQLIPTDDQSIDVTVFGVTCQMTITTFVHVVALPILSIDAESFVCIGDTVHMNVTGAVIYKSFNGYFDGYMEFVPLLDVMIAVTGYNEMGCMSIVLFPIDVRERPEVSLSSASPVCEGNGQTLNADGADYYEWRNLDTDTVIAAGDQEDQYFLPEVTTNYLLTGYNSLECTDTVQFTIIVHPLPVLTISNPLPICIGLPAQLEATGAANYLWNGISSANPYVFTAADTQNISLIGYSLYGCQSSILQVTIGNPTPDVFILGNTVVCDGESTTLQAYGASSFLWQSSISGFEVQVMPTADSLFIVVGTTEFGCTGSSSILVHVNETPSVDVSGIEDVCTGQLVHLEAVSNGALIWGNGDTSSSLYFYPAADTLISIAASSVNGCITSESFLISVNPLPVLVVTGNDELCAGQATVLSVTGAIQYAWDNGAVEDQVTVSPLISMNYVVSGIGENGCVGQAVYPVTLHPMPYVHFNFSADTICSAGSVFSWQSNPVGGTFSGSGIVNNQFAPNTAPAGLNEVTYSFTNQFGCTSGSSDQIFVLICTEIDEANSSDLVVYPIPAKDVLNISCQCQDVQSIAVINNVGQKVLEENALTGMTFRTLDISSIAPGLYDLILRSNNHTIQHRKILIQ